MVVKKKKILIYILVLLIIFFNQKSIKNSFAAVTFIENFNSTDYKDAANTTAEWETETSSAHLINGKWVHMDNTSSPRLYETIPDITNNYYTQITDDNNGQPIISMVGLGTDSHICFFFTKWSVNIGTSICGVGKQSCWTNLEGTVKGGKNNELCLPEGGTISDKQYEISAFANGNIAIAARASISGHQNGLYYAQWSSDTGWTNLDSETTGFELITDDVDKYIMSDAWKFLIDQYNEPTLFWTEYTGSIPNIVAKSFFMRGNSGSWKHADRVTGGKEEVINHSITISIGTVIVDYNFDSSGNIYFACTWSVLNTKAFKFNGTNYQDLSNTNLSLPVTNVSNLTTVVGQIITYPLIQFNDSNELFIVYSFSNNPYIGKWKDGAWKHVDNTTSGFELLFSGNNLHPVDFRLDPENKPIIVMKDWTTSQGHDYTEIYMTRWNGSNWTKADGTTSGFEAMSTLVSGEKLFWADSYCFDENNYPVATYVDYVSDVWLPVYFSRFTGEDIKGGDMMSNDQDTLINTGEGISNVTRTRTYCDTSTKSIFITMEPSAGTIRFTKLNNEMYSVTSGVLQSSTIAQNYAPGAKITTATLNAVDVIPAGTSLTYSLSADGGANWCTATNGVAVDFTTCGSDVSGEDLRWKASMSSASASSSPTIEYLWIDSDGLTEEDTSGQIIITGTIDPLLTLTLPSTSCSLSTFSESNLKTCNYQTQVTTNGVLGYIGYIRTDGLLRTSSSNIDNVSGGSVIAGTEAYGASTTESDSVNITRINDANSDMQQNVTDCTFMNNNTVSASVSALSESDQSFIYSSGPVNTDSNYLCHAAAISGLTPAGFYSQTVTITVVSNF